MPQQTLLPTRHSQEDSAAAEARSPSQTTESIAHHFSLLGLMLGLNQTICSALIFQQPYKQREGFLPEL